ncbi:MAG: hypothetical protein AVDCRST_MAG20-2014 [uncultured Acidimicrobiales bacterium]|uniref:Uncharacterized protein n=1 Tax=uncultured Acidimicrobiales bacterium TaxID=310071 RepID=A0A6J4I9Z9_9ACTN|nr:MAG: hypothetical protein AVDCRST_MAG20-2014 [uncultured Acidimicrobiales bacterium]
MGSLRRHYPEQVRRVDGTLPQAGASRPLSPVAPSSPDGLVRAA